MAVGISTTKNSRMLTNLRKKGYLAYGEKTFSKSEAEKVIKSLHKEKFLARMVNLSGTHMEPDIGTRYLIMYKK